MNIFEFFRKQQLTDTFAIEDYHRSKLIGHTKIVNFETNGPSTLRQEYQIPQTEAMLFGSIVDTLLTESSSFLNKYYIVEDEKSLTPSELKFVNFCVDNVIRVNDLTDKSLFAILDRCGFCSNMTKNVSGRLDKAKELFPIIEERLANYGKTFITAKQFEEATNCIEVLKTSEITKDIFANNKTVFYQVYLNDHVTKCLFDIIYIDPVKHEIHPFDLKCVSYPEHEFIKNSFYKFKYYRQAELYTALLKHSLQNVDFYESDSDEEKSVEWKIKPFKFLVINKDTLSPTLFSFPVIHNEAGQLQISNEKFVCNYKDIVQQIQWHVRNGQFMYSRDIYLQLMKNKKNKEKNFISVPIFSSSNEDAIIQTTTKPKPKLKLELTDLPSFYDIDESFVRWNSSGLQTGLLNAQDILDSYIAQTSDLSPSTTTSISSGTEQIPY